MKTHKRSADELRRALDADRDRLCRALKLGQKGKGRRFWCPFCQREGDHKSPDLSTEAGFRCHRCGWKGDGFKLVQEVRGVDFKAALAFLAEVYAVGGVVGRASASPSKKKGGRLHATVEAAAEAARWSVEQQVGGQHREVRRWAYYAVPDVVFAYILRFEAVSAVPGADGKIPKTFRPIYQDRDGWRVGDPSGLWPLYRLPELGKSADPVFVVEGEKATDAGRDIGLTCLTSAHGAQAPSKSDWSPLAGRDVVILPDHDETGQQYAQTLAGLLSRLHPPARIRILELPDLPEKGDLVDFCAARDAQEPEDIRAEIMRLLETAVQASPELPKPLELSQVAAADRYIILPSGSVSISASARQLFTKMAPAHQLFFRGGRIVELVERDAGGKALEIVGADGFRSRIERYAQLMVWRAGANGTPVLKPTTCPEDTAKALMATKEAQELLPRISGIMNCPVGVEKDGKLVILGQGYHLQRRGLIVTGGEVVPDIDLMMAVAALKELVVEFAFQTPGDRSRALASLITPALRMGGHLAGRVPIDIAESDASQSGKTYRQLCVCVLYNERPSLVTQRNGGVGSSDESFSQALVAGRMFIQFENIRGRMDSQCVEAFLTAESDFPARIPHRGEILVDPSQFILLLTSNGVETTRDLANRASIIRIHKRERYEFKAYPEGDLLAHIKAKQGFYLGCVFSVVREWISAGKPQTQECRHSFRDWVRPLDWIVQNIFQEAPLLDGHDQAQIRVSDPALTWLRKVALAVEADQGLDRDWSAAALGELCEHQGIEIPGLKDDTNVDQRHRKIGILMKRVFHDREQAEVEQFLVRREVAQRNRSDGQGSFEVKTYVFKRRTPAGPE